MSGLVVKRREIPRVQQTPEKRVLRVRHLEALVAPLKRQLSKLSKGQIRRNLSASNWGEGL